MTDYYRDVYLKRLNRYGLDYQSRIQGQRERDFENYLYKSIYRIDFEFDGIRHPGTLERYKQDYSETQGYLLTRRDLEIPNGTVLNIESRDGDKAPWMVWWIEQIEASGYNRYVVLKMSHLLSWSYNKTLTEQWAYFAGPGKRTINDTIQSSGANLVFRENNNLHLFVTPFCESLIRESYFEVKQGELTQAYEIKEFDVHSTPGVAYVSVDPVAVRDKSGPPAISEDDAAEDVFWLKGGI